MTGNTTIGNRNPFRYRGYYYDVETGLYYLKSRYYDTESVRFVTPDGITGGNGDFSGYNLFAYCGNNPISRLDTEGTIWKITLWVTVLFYLHELNIIAVSLGVDTAAIGAFFLQMYKDDKGVYHASFDCWQQYGGYNGLYDLVFDAVTEMSVANFSFYYGGNGYTFWAWKGDYINLGAGAELGIYRGASGHRVVDKSLAMKMGLTLIYQGKTIINYYPEAKQWWITGFNPDPNYLMVRASDLTAIYTIWFDDLAMYNSFKHQMKQEVNWVFYDGGKMAFLRL